MIMKKKIYVMPSTQVVLVNSQNMIAASGVTFDGNGSGEIQTIDGDATGSAMSRFGIWDDGDE